MRKLIAVVVLALAAGSFSANAEKTTVVTISSADVKKKCGAGSTYCGECLDRKCNTLVTYECKDNKCTKTTTTAAKRNPNNGAATGSKILEGGLLGTRTGFGSNSPAATGVVAPSAPSAGSGLR
jgi:hypothetical protein